MKKIGTGLVTLVMVITLILSSLSFASQPDIETMDMEEYAKNNKEAYEMYQSLEMAGVANYIQNTEIARSAYFDESKYFGGAYLNDQGKLVIQIVKDNKDIKKFFKEIVKNDEVQFKLVKYSSIELTELNTQLHDDLENLFNQGVNIQSLGIDIIDNSVQVSVIDLTNEEMKLLKNYCNTNMLQIIKAKEETPVEVGADIKAGTEVRINSSLSTLSFCAYRLYGGNLQPGVVISGHAGKNVGDIVKYNGYQIGTVALTGYYNHSDADAAWVPVDTSIHNLTDFNRSYYRIQEKQNTLLPGQVVFSSGKNNHRNHGVVDEVGITRNMGGYFIRDMASATYTAESGDSGAPITIYAGADRDIIVGVHSGGTGPEWFSRINNIFNEFNLQSLY